MRSVAATLTVVLLILSSQICFAEQILKIVFGDALHPWVIPEKNDGIIIDIIKETLEPSGYIIEPVYVPLARRLLTYKYGKVDVVCDINPKILKVSKLKGYLSVPAYAYENIFISLKKKGYKFFEISDLTDYELTAWQGAKIMIGGEYADMASKNKRYNEKANQMTQIKLLYKREIVIQLDRQIFKYFRKKVSEESNIDTNQPIDIFPLLGKNRCSFLFRDKKTQVIFDKNFEKLKKNNKYNRIFKKYSE